MARNNVTINILGDASDASRAIAQIDKKLGSLSGTAVSVGKTIASGLAVVGTAFAGVTAGAVSLGIKTAASMETAKIGFETMLGSAEKANSLLADLQSFAAKTPFEFPELQTAASSLISVGVNTKSVIPIMTTLGNVTSGMGTGAEGVKRATVALQQMSAAGRITGEDLNQLRDAGIPVFDLLAAATGKSKEEVAALAQAGKLGKAELDLLFKALESGKGLERFNGLMEKQSQSLSGQFSTLKDTVTMGLAAAVQPLVPLLGALIPAASKNAEWAILGLKNVLGTLVTQGKNLFDVFRSGDDVLGGTAEILDNVFGNTGKLIPVIMDVASVASDLWKVFSDGLLPVFVDFYKALPSFLTPLGIARDTLGFVARNAEALQPVMAALLGGFIAFKVVSTILHAVAAAQAALNLVMAMNPIALIVVALAALVAGLVWAYNNVTWFREGVQAVFGAIAAGAAWLGRVFSAIWGGIVAGFVWVRDTLKSIANWLIANVVNRFVDSMNLLIRGHNTVNIGKDLAQIPRLPTFHQGGVVPGAPGADVPILAQAGETIIPAGRSAGTSVIINFNGPVNDPDQVTEVLNRFFSRGGALTNGRGGTLAPA